MRPMNRLTVVVLGSLLLGTLGACSDDDGGQNADAAVDARVLPDVDPMDPDPGFDDTYVPSGPEQTVTTLLQIERPRYGYSESVVDNFGRPRIPAEEVGQRYPQPGEPHFDRDDLGVGDATDTGARSLFYFAHFSDVQIVDVESPAYVSSNKYTNLGDLLPAYHVHGPATPVLFDSAVQTALQFSLTRSFDFMIHTGDAVEDNQANELDWYLTVIGGGEVHADSGAVDDPIPGPNNDLFDPFLAQGVPSDVPFYSVIGNHDIEVNGNFPNQMIVEANDPAMLEKLAPSMENLGARLPGIGTADHAPAILSPSILPAFTMAEASYDHDLWLGEEQLRGLETGPVPADPDRAFLSGCDYIDAHFNAGGSPDGHGFRQEARTSCQGWYAVEPSPGAPFRLLVLDSGPYLGGEAGAITPPLNADGSVDESRLGDPAQDQIAWLQAELEQAEADNVAVVVASHHPSSDLGKPGLLTSLELFLDMEDPDIADLWDRHFIHPEESISGADFRDLLASFPNVIAHLVGHSHENLVLAVCPDGSQIDGAETMAGTTCPAPPAGRGPENGYWEVMAPSVRDFPNQFRITEIVDHGDGTGTVFSTLVTPQGGAGGLVVHGLFLALAQHQLDGSSYTADGGSLADRNVALRFRWPTALLATVAATTAATRIESQTTLADPAPGLPTLPVWP